MAEIFDIGGLGEHLGRLLPEQQALRLAAFYSLLESKAASATDLALQCGLAPCQAKQGIEEMADQGILVLNNQRAVVGSHGLSLIPTDHRLIINGHNLFTWCAADAVGIPAALGVDATIISQCFQGHEPIEITMSGGEIRSANHPDTRIWVIEADLGRPIAGCA